MHLDKSNKRALNTLSDGERPIGRMTARHITDEAMMSECPAPRPAPTATAVAAPTLKGFADSLVARFAARILLVRQAPGGVRHLRRSTYPIAPGPPGAVATSR